MQDKVTTEAMQAEIWYGPAPGSLSGNLCIVWENTFTNRDASYKGPGASVWNLAGRNSDGTFFEPSTEEPLDP
jgi:hypothetical protein